MATLSEKRPRQSWRAYLLVGRILFIPAIEFGLLALVWLGFVVALGAAVLGLAALHYLVWGLWLSRVLREDAEADALMERAAKH